MRECVCFRTILLEHPVFMAECKILSWNIRGGRNLDKRLSIFKYIKTLKPTICLLQETHVLETDLDTWESNWDVGKIYINPGSSRSAGQAFLINKDITFLEHRIVVRGRLHTLKFKINNYTLTIANIYAPNSDHDRIAFFSNLMELLVSYDYGDQIILGGDFNVTLGKEDKFGGVENNPKSRNKLKDIMKTFDLKDIWRDRNKDLKHYTWEQPSPLIRCRLDYFLIQHKYHNLVTSSKIIPGMKSDHKIIEISLKMKNYKRGSGFWKLNSSILNEEIYTREMSSLINQVWDDNSNITDVQTRFDYLKYKIMDYTIQYCKKRAKNKRQKEAKLIHELEMLDIKICNLTASNEEISHYHELKTELEIITEEKAKGAWVRSRLEFVEKHEKK